MNKPATRQPGELFDPGLQPERTILAWRRTCLAMAVDSVAAGRVLAPTLGWGALIASTAGVVASLILLGAAVARNRSAQASLRAAGNLAAAPGGALIGAVATVCTALGLLALAVVLRH